MTAFGKKILMISIILGLLSACSYRIKPEFRSILSPDQLTKIDNHPFKKIKVYHKNGSLSVLKQWTDMGSDKKIAVTGQQFDYNRDLIYEGSFELAYEDIVRIELNDLKKVKGKYITTAMIGQVGMLFTNILMTIYCINNSCNFD